MSLWALCLASLAVQQGQVRYNQCSRACQAGESATAFKIWTHILKSYRPLYALCFSHQLVDLIWLNLLCHPQQSYNILSFLQNNNPDIIMWYKKGSIKPLKITSECKSQSPEMEVWTWIYECNHKRMLIASFEKHPSAWHSQKRKRLFFYYFLWLKKKI